jgi:hypothetical protein
MADKFGKIIVCGDYEGDLSAIVKKINPLQWSRGHSGVKPEWAVEQECVVLRPDEEREVIVREVIVLKGEVHPNASVRPIGDIFVLSDGRRCFANDADESFIEQWKADYVADGAMAWDNCTLSELSALISPHLNKGTIEFVAVRADDLEGISHERLLVRSDGSAEWHECRSYNCFQFWDDQWTFGESEYYEPTTQRRTARIAREAHESGGDGWMDLDLSAQRPHKLH